MYTCAPYQLICTRVHHTRSSSTTAFTFSHHQHWGAGARRKFPIIGRCGCSGCCPQALILITRNEPAALVSMKHAPTMVGRHHCTHHCTHHGGSPPPAAGSHHLGPTQIVGADLQPSLTHTCGSGTSFDRYGHCLFGEESLKDSQSVLLSSILLCHISRIANGLSAAVAQPCLPIRDDS